MALLRTLEMLEAGERANDRLYRSTTKSKNALHSLAEGLGVTAPTRPRADRPIRDTVRLDGTDRLT